jgi:hypothetical protein
VRHVSFEQVSRTVGLGLLLLSLGAAGAAAGGFREQVGWQFRSPAETQVRLNEEALRLQLEQQGTVLPGAGGGNVSVPLSSGAGGLGLGGSSATLGNQTNTTTNVNINITGDGNDVNVDGYLNLEAEQITDGQTSNIATGGAQ